MRLQARDAATTLCDIIARCSDGHQRPYVVAVDGRSGTGKSILAVALANGLEAGVIDGDSFFAGGIALGADSPQARANRCIDWRRQRAVILTLLDGGPAAWLPFDWEAFDGRLSPTPVHLGPRPVVILEGVYSARPELADLVDLRVLLKAPHAVRMQRLEAREGCIGPWERQWHEAEDWYFEHAAPDEWFDIIVDNH